jgi:AcrR family transcriptional regulator
MTKKPSPGKRIAGASPNKLAGERIREAARDLFYQQGIRAVGVDEIVARAGVTKPSLYRSFASKDELAAVCLRDRSDDYLRRFDAAMAAYPEDPRAGFIAWLEQLSQRATKPDYRGCALTNAAVEYPERKHPARLVAAANKREFRAKLKTAATAMGAPEPAMLGDALLLLIEGAYASGQLFGADGPARVVTHAAEALIEACCAKKSGRL